MYQYEFYYPSIETKYPWVCLSISKSWEFIRMVVNKKLWHHKRFTLTRKPAPQRYFTERKHSQIEILAVLSHDG